MIAEPTTTLTDYALAVLSIALGVRLLRLGQEPRRRAVAGFAAAFLAMGLAAFLGGTTHGFREYLGSNAHAWLWFFTLAAVGAASAFLLVTLAYSEFSGAARRALAVVAVLQFAVYVAWIASHDEFLWAILVYLPTMLVMLTAHARGMARSRPGSGWIVAGVMVALAGAGIQASGFALHEHFNHNDLYHVVQMIGTVLLYRGVRELRDA